MITVVKAPGYQIIFGSQKEVDELSFELLEESRGDVSPAAIKRAKEALRRRELHSYVLESLHKNSISKIMK